MERVRAMATFSKMAQIIGRVERILDVFRRYHGNVQALNDDELDNISYQPIQITQINIQ